MKYVHDFGDNQQYDLILESILPSRGRKPYSNSGTSMLPTSRSAGRSAVSDPNTLAVVHLNKNHWGRGNFNGPLEVR